MTVWLRYESNKKTEELGKASLLVSRLIHNTGCDEWFEFKRKDQVAGKVHIETDWFPSSTAQSTMTAKQTRTKQLTE